MRKLAEFVGAGTKRPVFIDPHEVAIIIGDASDTGQLFCHILLANGGGTVVEGDAKTVYNTFHESERLN